MTVSRVRPTRTTAAALAAACLLTSAPLAVAQATQPSAEVKVFRGAEVPDLSPVKGGPAKGMRADGLEVVAAFDKAMPTCFTFSQDGGRLFVAFPRWRDPVNYTVAEVVGGDLKPFPDAETNAYYPDQPQKNDPKTHLVNVQSILVDAKNRLWIVDTGNINLGTVTPGGPKMWAYDLATGERVKDFPLGGDAIKEKTYLNDVRFDLTKGDEGYAYLTDSGVGAIVVVDLATGEAWRKLDGTLSTQADESITLGSEGEPLLIRPPDSDETKQPAFKADGLALGPDGSTLYYTPLTSRSMYAVDTADLRDRDADATKSVRRIADMASANDGIVADAQGRIYTTDFEDNAIRRYTPPAAVNAEPAAQVAGSGLDQTSSGIPDQSGETTEELLVQDERLLWPDCVIVRDGTVYFTSNQLARQPQFHRGTDERVPPYALFRFPSAGADQIDRK